MGRKFYLCVLSEKCGGLFLAMIGLKNGTYHEHMALRPFSWDEASTLRGIGIMATPIQIANTFITRFGENTDLSHMKLQKLVFFADGWQVGFSGVPLVNERPQVWRYGPVFRSLYNALTGYGNTPIKSAVVVNPFTGSAPIVERNDDNDSRLIDWIWNKYGRYSAMDLSRETHALGTPWHTMAERHNFAVPFNLEIPNEVLEPYFRSLASADGAVAT